MDTSSIHDKIDRDRFRAAFNEFTRKAFEFLPSFDDPPKILDVGCGSGVGTLELARVSGGRVIGIDVDASQLAKFRQRMESAGISERVTAELHSLQDKPFPEGEFDIVWSEGVVGVIGFKKALSLMIPLLKLGGYLVIHDQSSDRKKKLVLLSKSGLEVLAYFKLPKQIWWDRYYEPLERHISMLRMQYQSKREFQRILDNAQAEIEMVRANPLKFGSVFFIGRKD